jgi:hypothetical protein
MSASRRAAVTRLTPLALLLGVVLVTLPGCYVVPAPAPRAGVPPPVPPHVLATPHCGWAYGPGWYGWGWYGNC